MGVKARQVAARLVVALGAANLAACGGEQKGAPAPFEDPFNFAEVQSLAGPIGSMTPATRAQIIRSLRRDNGRTAELYRSALSRFEAIYGDGVGPARGTADYLGCRAAFSKVDVLIRTPAPLLSDDELEKLRASLIRCQKVAEEWSGPAEMATFGNDLKAMANGAMLVLGYAAALSEPELGQQIYREAALLRPGATAGN
jgi:hypothetical protein